MPVAPRPFSTSARVHPNILPHLRASSTRRSPIRWWPVALVGVSAIGYGAKVYVDAVREQRAAMEAREREDAERRRRNAMLLDVYGDRESLEELEKAVQFYEKKS